MSQYVSKFSGVEIDRAVAYYNDMQRIGRTILQVSIVTPEGGVSPWQSTTGTPDSTMANFYIDITADGVNTISSAALDFPPQVYFLDEDGLRWEMEYRFAVANNTNYVRCFSNAQKDGTIVIGVVTQEDIYEKTISNLVEVKSRGSYNLIIAPQELDVDKVADCKLPIPETNKYFYPTLTVIPLQLIGYYISLSKGLDVDKPRNLAKSVTVE